MARKGSIAGGGGAGPAPHAHGRRGDAPIRARIDFSAETRRVDRNTDPAVEEYEGLLARWGGEAGGRTFAIRANTDFQAALVSRPGDPPGAERGTEIVAEGEVVKIASQPSQVENQTAAQLAELGARGWYDVIPESEYAAAAA